MKLECLAGANVHFDLMRETKSSNSDIGAFLYALFDDQEALCSKRITSYAACFCNEPEKRFL